MPPGSGPNRPPDVCPAESPVLSAARYAPEDMSHSVPSGLGHIAPSRPVPKLSSQPGITAPPPRQSVPRLNTSTKTFLVTANRINAVFFAISVYGFIVSLLYGHLCFSFFIPSLPRL